METKKQRSVVVVPYPFQGHITPMLQLGSILHSRGFSIVVVHTEHISPTSLSHPEFVFHGLPDGLSEQDMKFENLLWAIYRMNESCRAPLQDYLLQLVEKEKMDVACVVYDNIMFFVESVASNLEIPSIVLRPANAAYFHSVVSLLQQMDSIFPFPESSMLEPLPDLHPLRFKDLPMPIINNDVPEPVRQFSNTTTDIKSSVACIWNTVDEIDHSSLSKLEKHYKVPFFPIGPFHKLASESSSTSLLEEDLGCLKWLDTQAPGSVLYVSIGSFFFMSKQDAVEMASGLANSDHPFLWVVRPGSVEGSGKFHDEFERSIGSKGRVVKWAPQRDVLAHPAVGGFLTHCGWNSTLESICEGVPMICSPISSDQPVNARYLTEVWKVGLELERVEKGVIEKAIRKLMAGDEGREVKKRVMDLKKKLEGCIRKDGSSYRALDQLVDFISKLPSGKLAKNVTES